MTAITATADYTAIKARQRDTSSTGTLRVPSDYLEVVAVKAR